MRRVDKPRGCLRCGWTGLTIVQLTQLGITVAAILAVVATAVFGALLQRFDMDRIGPWFGLFAIPAVLFPLISRLERCRRCGSRDLDDARHVRQQRADADTRAALAAAEGPSPVAQQIDNGGEQRNAVVTPEGRPLPADASFFAPPPAAIGTLVTANTTMRTRHQRWPLWRIVLLAFALGGALGAAAFAGLHALEAELVVALTIAVVLNVGVTIAVIALMAPDFGCSYIGDQGYVHYHLGVLGVREVRSLAYREASSLWVYHGDREAPIPRASHYRWKTPRGETLLSLKGEEEVELARMRAVARAWSRFRLPALEQEMASGGACFRFGKGTLRLEPQRLVLEAPNAAPEALEASQIMDATASPRKLTLRFEGTEQRSWTAAYGDVESAECLLALLDKHLGVNINLATGKSGAGLLGGFRF